MQPSNDAPSTHGANDCKDNQPMQLVHFDAYNGVSLIICGEMPRQYEVRRGADAVLLQRDAALIVAREILRAEGYSVERLVKMR